MSPLHFVIMLIIAIAILTVLTLKFKMHPVNRGAIRKHEKTQ